jgi:hypothetical protein
MPKHHGPPKSSSLPSHHRPSHRIPQHKTPPAPFNSTRPPCQICGKSNHQALDCYHRMDYSFQGRHPPSQLAAMVAHTNSQFSEEEPWYADSGANQHIALSTA